MPVYYFVSNHTESCPPLAAERLLTSIPAGQSFEGLTVALQCRGNYAPYPRSVVCRRKKVSCDWRRAGHVTAGWRMRRCSPRGSCWSGAACRCATPPASCRPSTGGRPCTPSPWSARATRPPPAAASAASSTTWPWRRSSTSTRENICYASVNSKNI